MNDYISPLEREYQNKIVRLFREQLNYEYLGKLQYGKDKKALDNGQANSPIIESELRRFLSGSENGNGYTPNQIDEAIEQLKREAHLSDQRRGALLDTNQALYDTLIRHIAVQPDPEKPHENVYLFNFNNPLANNFAIAEEVSYIDPLTGKHSRPDLVIYVNGIALCVIELKQAQSHWKKVSNRTYPTSKTSFPLFSPPYSIR